MKTFFKRWIDYGFWADLRLLETLEAVARDGGEVEPALGRLGHIVGAQRVWLARLEDQPWHTDWIWPGYDLPACRRKLNSLADSWSGYFSHIDETSFDRPVAYRTGAGTRYQSSVAEILTHLVAHGAYHRGQIATDLRAAGVDPPATDLIVYARGS